jgi:hypothetical protein
LVTILRDGGLVRACTWGVGGFQPFLFFTFLNLNPLLPLQDSFIQSPINCYYMNELVTIESNLSTGAKGITAAIDRPPLLMEYLPDRPHQVLKKVFSTPSRCDTLKETFSTWLASIDANEDPPEEGMKSTLEKEFYAYLPLLIDALHQISRKGSKESNLPLQATRDFCMRFSKVYVRRELWCFASAVVNHLSENPCDYSPDTALEWHEEVSTLIEVAYLIQSDL